MLRTSKLGTRHFAHARRGTCSTAPETAEHLLAKMAVVEGINRAGWTACPEQHGTTPAGDEWRADVLAIKGRVKVAFEVQWSRQDRADTERRQQRYANARIRGLWLFRQTDFPIEQETPSFKLVIAEESKDVGVRLPSPSYHPSLSNREAEGSMAWGQFLPLADFVAGALTGKLRYAPALGQTMPVEIQTVDISCWKCQKTTNVVTGLNFAASRILPGCPDIPTTIYEFDECLPDGGAVIASMLPAPLLKRHGIGELKPRKSKTAGGEYLSNGCVHCDALQGKFFEHEYAFEAQTTFEIVAEFKAEWVPMLEEAEDYVYRWWFDQS